MAHAGDSQGEQDELTPSARICTVVSVLNQLKSFYVNIELAKADSLDDSHEILQYCVRNDGETTPIDQNTVARINEVESLSLAIVHRFSREVSSFFGILDNENIETALDSLFKAEYVSDQLGKGSCAAVFLFRLLQFVRAVERCEWSGRPHYRYRFSNELSLEVDRFSTLLQSLPRGRMSYLQDSHTVLVTLDERQYSCGLGVSHDPPTKPSVYTIRHSASIFEGALDHSHDNFRPALNMHQYKHKVSDRESRPSNLRVLGDLVPQKKLASEKSSITGSFSLDLAILQFLAPRDLHCVREMNQYYRRLVTDYCRFPLRWGTEFTRIARHFFRKEWGCVHMRLESWPKKDCEYVYSFFNNQRSWNNFLLNLFQFFSNFQWPVKNG